MSSVGGRALQNSASNCFIQLLIAGSFVGEGVIEKLKEWEKRDVRCPSDLWDLISNSSSGSRLIIFDDLCSTLKIFSDAPVSET